MLFVACCLLLQLVRSKWDRGKEEPGGNVNVLVFDIVLPPVSSCLHELLVWYDGELMDDLC